jgi:hypothetical protein
MPLPAHPHPEMLAKSARPCLKLADQGQPRHELETTRASSHANFKDCHVNFKILHVNFKEIRRGKKGGRRDGPPGRGGVLSL